MINTTAYRSEMKRPLTLRGLGVPEENGNIHSLVTYIYMTKLAKVTSKLLSFIEMKLRYDYLPYNMEIIAK